MKTTLIFLLFFSLTSFGQSNRNVKQQLKTCQDSLQVQQQIVLDLNEQLESAKMNSQNSAEIAEKLKTENEAFRKILIDYIKQIDNSQNKISELEAELEKCKKK